jgi:hypothetical protein
VDDVGWNGVCTGFGDDSVQWTQHECGITAVCCMHMAGHLHKHCLGSNFRIPLPNAAKHIIVDSIHLLQVSQTRVALSALSVSLCGGACVLARQTLDDRCCCTNIPTCCMFVCEMLLPGLVNVSCRVVLCRAVCAGFQRRLVRLFTLMRWRLRHPAACSPRRQAAWVAQQVGGCGDSVTNASSLGRIGGPCASLTPSYPSPS